jgi:hypothetical protein
MREGEHHIEFEFPNKVTFGHVSSTNAYLDVNMAGKVSLGTTR